MKIIVKTLLGLEPVLADELRSLNLSNIQLLDRGISCEGNWAQLYQCNYLLRTAIRVLLPIQEFEIETQDDYYEAIKSIKWVEYLRKKSTIAVDTTIFGDIFSNSRFATYRAKDAIVDRLEESRGFRPDVDTDNPDIRINIHLSKNKLSVALDSSGQSLHLRNYKYRPFLAPLNEVLAAGILAHSKWKGESPLYDPMCGSGTFTTEALMIAANIPSGKFVYKFGFEKWPEFHIEIWKKIKQTAEAQIRKPECEIFSSDLNAFAVRDLKKNLQKLTYKSRIQIQKKDFFKLEPTTPGKVFINPPYDKRIRVENLNELYLAIGDRLKSNWQECSAWMIHPDPTVQASFGLSPDQSINLDNGGIKSKLVNFNIYEGSKKNVVVPDPTDK